MFEALLTKIRDSVIGDNVVVDGPFGPKRLTYADYTASGRALTFIEDYIRDTVLPYYANTHTETSYTGLQTTTFREDARAIIRSSVGADDDYAVIFTGSGATGAISTLIDILNIRIPADMESKHHLTQHIPENDRPVIFIGPYEHHSNEVPWRETIATIVPISEDADGRIDLDMLEAEITKYADRKVKIGSFSAASNVTGILSDVKGIGEILHRHGALTFWDYAAAGPYVDIDMVGHHTGQAKEAVFLSPHKFVGGPGSPGVLIVHKKILTNSVPARPGGGTVSYVNPVDHLYITDSEHREEGGTPAIIESIRAGLAFKLKDTVTVEAIHEKEHKFVRMALTAWADNENIHVLGNPNLPRLSIISFTVNHNGRNLHHDFVVALLNDLFGIQARGGCSCAGPYGHRLLQIGMDQSKAFEASISEGCGGIKPGWIRLGFNYFISDEVAHYIIEAVKLIAAEGWKLLPLYHFDPDNGSWKHRHSRPNASLNLHDLDLTQDNPKISIQTTDETILHEHLSMARRLFHQADKALAGETAETPAFNQTAEQLRWFTLPKDVEIELTSQGETLSPEHKNKFFEDFLPWSP